MPYPLIPDAALVPGLWRAIQGQTGFWQKVKLIRFYGEDLKSVCCSNQNTVRMRAQWNKLSWLECDLNNVSA